MDTIHPANLIGDALQKTVLSLFIEPGPLPVAGVDEAGTTARTIVELRRIFGQNVHRLRMRLRMTQEQLCERAEIDRSYLQRIEKGTSSPTVEVAVRLRAALGCPWDDIFAGVKQVLFKPRSRPRPTRHGNGVPRIDAKFLLPRGWCRQWEFGSLLFDISPVSGMDHAGAIDAAETCKTPSPVRAMAG